MTAMDHAAAPSWLCDDPDQIAGPFTDDVGERRAFTEYVVKRA